MKKKLLNDDCSIELSFSFNDGILILEYDIKNLSETNIYISRYIWDQNETELDKSGVFGIIENGVHVYIVAGLAVLGLDCMQLTFSASSLIVYDNPFVVTIGPGELYNSKIVKTLPLVPYSVDGNRPAEASELMMDFVFKIDYYLDNDDMQSNIIAVETSVGKAYDVPLHMRVYRKSLCLGPFDEKIPLINSNPSEPALRSVRY